MDEMLERLLTQRQLCEQAVRLRFRLLDAKRAAPWRGERYIRLCSLLRRLDDRISRREEHFRALLEGRTPVTTVQLAQWVRAALADYRTLAGADPAEMAGLACDALALWDQQGSIPDWVHGVCERVCERDRLAGFSPILAEKPIRVEPDGDCIWA